MKFIIYLQDKWPKTLWHQSRTVHKTYRHWCQSVQTQQHWCVTNINRRQYYWYSSISTNIYSGVH